MSLPTSNRWLLALGSGVAGGGMLLVGRVLRSGWATEVVLSAAVAFGVAAALRRVGVPTLRQGLLFTAAALVLARSLYFVEMWTGYLPPSATLWSVGANVSLSLALAAVGTAVAWAVVPLRRPSSGPSEPGGGLQG